MAATPTTTIRLEPELTDRIDAAAKAAGLGRSAWIRQAIEEKLAYRVIVVGESDVPTTTAGPTPTPGLGRVLPPAGKPSAFRPQPKGGKRK